MTWLLGVLAEIWAGGPARHRDQAAPRSEPPEPRSPRLCERRAATSKSSSTLRETPPASTQGGWLGDSVEASGTRTVVVFVDGWTIRGPASSMSQTFLIAD